MSYADVIMDTPGLVAYYRLGETSGNWLDSKGGNPLTIFSGPGGVRGVPGLLVGDPDKACQHTNASQMFLTAAYGSYMDTGPELSVEWWMYIDPSATSSGNAVRRDDPPTWRFLVDGVQFGPITVLCLVYDTTDYISMYTPGGVITKGQVHHLVGTYSSTLGQVRFYSNAQNYSAAPNRAPTTPVKVTNSILRVGGGTQGVIDEVAIYNKALTQEQVAQHYQAGLGNYPRILGVN